MSIAAKLERHSIPEPNSGCQIWLRALSTDGYAQVWNDGRLRNAHIVAYELANGPVPEGLEIDHLCRVRCCINPDHLEAVTSKENTRRGTVVAAMKRRALPFGAPCPHGHTGVVYYARKNGKQQRQCPTCHRERRRVCQTPDSHGPT